MLKLNTYICNIESWLIRDVSCMQFSRRDLNKVLQIDTNKENIKSARV